MTLISLNQYVYRIHFAHQILLICYPGFLEYPVYTYVYVRSRPTSISFVCRRVDTRKYMDTPVRKGVGIPHGAVASTHCTMQSALSAKSAALFFTFCFFPPHLRLVSRFFILSSFHLPFPSLLGVPLQSILWHVTLAKTECRSETEGNEIPPSSPPPSLRNVSFSPFFLIFFFPQVRRPPSFLPSLYITFQPRLLSF